MFKRFANSAKQNSANFANTNNKFRKFFKLRQQQKMQIVQQLHKLILQFLQTSQTEKCRKCSETTDSAKLANSSFLCFCFLLCFYILAFFTQTAKKHSANTRKTRFAYSASPLNVHLQKRSSPNSAKTNSSTNFANSAKQHSANFGQTNISANLT